MKLVRSMVLNHKYSGIPWIYNTPGYNTILFITRPVSVSSGDCIPLYKGSSYVLFPYNTLFGLVPTTVL